MPTDKVAEALLDALRRGLAQGREQRLYRSGKLDGLFLGRTGAGAEAAARALREGLIETVRTETKGKTVIDWVRLTPKAVDFLHEHESPRRALEELREELRTTKEGVPAWSAEVRRSLAALGDKVAEDSARLLRRVEVLSERVEEALRRLALLGPHLPDGVAQAVPWAEDALTYLERRRAGGAPQPCPLPELFAAVAASRAEFTIGRFHDGLRRLHERRLLQLLPASALPSDAPAAEYALLDGPHLYYYVTP
jgi:hypothetical protein